MYVPHIHNRHFSQEQIEELKGEIRKTEYEKAREPLIKELAQANKKIIFLSESLQLMDQAIRLIINNIEADYLEIIVDTSIPKARFYTGDDVFKDIQETKIKTIKVPVKQNLMSDIARILNEIEKKRRNVI